MNATADVVDVVGVVDLVVLGSADGTAFPVEVVELGVSAEGVVEPVRSAPRT